MNEIVTLADGQCVIVWDQLYHKHELSDGRLLILGTTNHLYKNQEAAEEALRTCYVSMNQITRRLQLFQRCP